MTKEELQLKSMMNVQVRLKRSELVNVSELCEVRWQAAILYAQKSYSARQERKTSMATYNKTAAIYNAKEVWNAYGFSENEVVEHIKIFEDTILRKGGTYASVTDYFVAIAKADAMYPRLTTVDLEECAN